MPSKNKHSKGTNKPVALSRTDRLDEIAMKYSSWVAEVHSQLSAMLAGRDVRAPIDSAVLPGQFALTEAGRLEQNLTFDQFGRNEPAGHRETIAFADVLARNWYAVIVGDPGGGKSTLARAAARHAARPFADGRIKLSGAGAAQRLPVLFRAAEFGTALAELTAGCPGTKIRLEHVAIMAGWDHDVPREPANGEPLPAAQLMKLVDHAFATGKLLLIVDGLDEVADTRDQRRLAALLEELTDRTGRRQEDPGDAVGVQVMVTTRPAGHRAAAVDYRFVRYSIAPLSVPAAQDMARSWASAAGASPPEWYEVLGRAVDDLTADGGTGGNPLLLVSLVSAVLAHPGADRRRWTRRELCRFLLNSAVRRGLESYPSARTGSLELFQCAFGYLYYRDLGTGQVASDDHALDGLLAAAAAEAGLDGIPRQELTGWMAAMGLFAERAHGVKAFPHPSIGQYLAAVWLTRNPSVMSQVIGWEDPRWAEPIRLAFADLALTCGSGFGRLIDVLIDDGRAAPLAALLASGSALTGGQVGRLLSAMLREMIRRGAAAPADAPIETVVGIAVTAEAMIARLLAAPRDHSGERQQAIRKVLTELLGDGRELAVALAARLIEGLGLFDSQIALQLLTGQFTETGRYGWQTVRALEAVADRDLDKTAGNTEAAVAAAIAKLSSDDAKALREIRLRRTGAAAASAAPVGPPPGQGYLPTGELPFRAALLDEPALRARITADAGWARIVICLYGGIPFVDRVGRRREIDHWLMIRAGTAAADARHKRAGLALDALAETKRGTQPHVGLSVPLITVDSPLTLRLTGWLREGRSSGDVARLCLALAEDLTENADTRGDALIAWAASGADQPCHVHATLAAAAADTDVARRLRWRLARTEFLLRDKLAADAEDDDVADVVGASGSDIARAWSAVARAREALGGSRELPVSSLSQAPLVYLLSRMAPEVVNSDYAVAVILDVSGRSLTAGGGQGLVASLCRLPSLAADLGLSEWRLDPLAPTRYADVPGALRVIAGLADAWYLVRCWLLDRLGPEAVAAGYAPLALLLLRDTVRTGSTAARSVAEGITELQRALPAAVAVALAADQWQAWTPASAQAYETRIARGEAAPDPVLLRAAADCWVVPGDRARALLRAARLLPAAEQAEFVAAACEQLDAAGGAFSADNAVLLRASGSLEAARLLREHRAEFAASQCPLWEPLWRIESGVREKTHARSAQDRQRVGWAALTAAAFCHDARRSLDISLGEDGQTAAWESLATARDPVAVLRRLRATAGGWHFVLDAPQLALVRALVVEGQADAACLLLSLGRLQHRVREVDLLREHPAAPVADLATLLVIELGVLDVPGVSALARLFAAADERIRIRAVLASDALWHTLVASELEPSVLAELARQATSADGRDPWPKNQIHSVLTRVFYDDLASLRTAAAALDDDSRPALLASVYYLSDATCVEFTADLARTAGRDLDAMFTSIRDVLEGPRLSAHTRARVSAILDDVRAQPDRDRAAVATRLLGACAEPTAELVSGLARHVREARAAGAEAACDALGRLAERAGQERAEVRDLAVAELTAVTEQVSGHLLIAALSALCRAGERIETYAGKVPARIILQSLLAQAPELPASEAVCRRAALFVLRPEPAAGQDTDGHVAGLLDWIAGEVADSAPAPGDLEDPSPAQDILGLLHEIGAVCPAAVRALADRRPGLRPALAGLSADALLWTSRKDATCVLLLLGPADARVFRPMLAAMTRNTMARDAMLEHLSWLSGVTDDGLDVLAEAADGPRDGALAALRVLGGLATGDVLAPAQHQRVIRLVMRLARRDDAQVPVFQLSAERRAESIGSLADEAARVISELRQLPDLNRDEVIPAGFIEVPAEPGHSRDQTVTFAVPVPAVANLFRYQKADSAAVASIKHIRALDAAAWAAGAERVGLIDVLEATCSLVN